jgi:nucleoside-diphosphate-sugar epimerase
MAKRVLLTGAAGFVGANLGRRLLEDGHEVHVLVRPGSRSWRIQSILADLHVHEVDLADREVLGPRVARVRPDRVFHLAAHGAYPFQTDLRRMVETNLVGTLNLVEAALSCGFEAFVHAGSSSEYGFKDHAPPETEAMDPNSDYAWTKASATLFCRHTARARDAYVPTLRLYSAYGPYEEPTRLLPTLIVRGREGRLPPLGEPGVARDFVHVDDVVEAFCLAAAGGGGERAPVYNVGTGVQTTLREVVEVAREVMGVTEEPRWASMPNRRWDTEVWVSDSRKIQRELGWRPRHTFPQGFRRFAGWFEEHPDLLEHYRHALAGDPVDPS